MAHPVPLAMPETSSLVDSSVSRSEDGRVDGGGSIERSGEFSRIAVFLWSASNPFQNWKKLPIKFLANKHPPPRWCEKSKNQTWG